jgi:hypothetical protein
MIFKGLYNNYLIRYFFYNLIANLFRFRLRGCAVFFGNVLTLDCRLSSCCCCRRCCCRRCDVAVAVHRKSGGSVTPEIKKLLKMLILISCSMFLIEILRGITYIQRFYSKFKSTYKPNDEQHNTFLPKCQFKRL